MLHYVYRDDLLCFYSNLQNVCSWLVSTYSCLGSLLFDFWLMHSIFSHYSRSIQPKPSETTSELSSNQPDSPEIILKSNCGIDTSAVEAESSCPLLSPMIREDKTASSIADEWEQLVVSEVPKTFSPTCISKPKTVILSPDSNKQLDIKTSRILERLEAPKQLKTKVTSAVVTNKSFSETNMPTKKPLIPFQPNYSTDRTLSSSQLIKPNFQRLKRKHR